MAFLGKGKKKKDMLQLAEELGINATLNMTVPSIKIAITNSEGYEEEFVKNLYETIIENGKRLEMRLEELERADKMRLEDPELVCLPLAVVEISGNFGTVQTKAAVCGNNLNQHGRYLLGNKTAELIKGNLGYNFLPVDILNAVQTRSQVKAAREERGIDSGEAKKGEDEAIIVSPNAEDEILIPALQEYVPELALLRAASQVQVTNQVYSLEKELLVKNREDKLGNVVKLIVVPEGLRDPIKSLCHEGTSAHLGITKSKDKLNRYFYWPNCYRDMEQFVKTCDQCQRAGKPNDKKKAPLKLVSVIQEVFTKLNIDACGPLPITSKGNRYLITAICMSSKFPEAIPVSDISSVSVTDALLNIFSRMGFPREIQCDQGTSFTSALTTEFFERFRILVSGIILCNIHRVTLLSDFIER
ncbi:gypsy retrotransposon integrase-like protein 1 [Trichonephila clavipes]|nr:gypsy retrotransposon integrase-like protein 1 [Trichonephila clavipes]